MPGTLAGRTAVVTGASRGIGHAIAAALRADGARVVGTRTGRGDANDRAESDACDDWIVADFADEAQIERCAGEVARLSPDVLVNNAGINRIAPFAQIPLADFTLIQRVNVVAPFRLCQAVIPGMRDRRWGRIVNVASIWGVISKAQRASYSASKFALDGLTAALSAEHAGEGILANCVAPGFIDTELTRTVLSPADLNALVSTVPARRLGQPDEIAAFVRWLASDDNQFVTGQILVIDGGFTRV